MDRSAVEWWCLGAAAAALDCGVADLGRACNGGRGNHGGDERDEQRGRKA